MAIKVEPTKESVVCPEEGCGNLCYWTVHPPKQLRCCKCGHIVEGWPVEEEEPQQDVKTVKTRIRGDING